MPHAHGTRPLGHRDIHMLSTRSILGSENAEAGLLADILLLVFPSASSADSDVGTTTLIDAYSSGNCSGFTPDSLFIQGCR